MGVSLCQMLSTWFVEGIEPQGSYPRSPGVHPNLKDWGYSKSWEMRGQFYFINWIISGFLGPIIQILRSILDILWIIQVLWNNLDNFVQLQISSWQLYLPVRCRNTFLSYSSPALALAGGWWGQNRKIVQFREEGTNNSESVHPSKPISERIVQPARKAGSGSLRSTLRW